MSDLNSIVVLNNTNAPMALPADTTATKASRAAKLGTGNRISLLDCQKPSQKVVFVLLSDCPLATRATHRSQATNTVTGPQKARHCLNWLRWSNAIQEITVEHGTCTMTSSWCIHLWVGAPPWPHKYILFAVMWPPADDTFRRASVDCVAVLSANYAAHTLHSSRQFGQLVSTEVPNQYLPSVSFTTFVRSAPE